MPRAMDGERARAQLGYVPPVQHGHRAAGPRGLGRAETAAWQRPAPLTGRIGKSQKTRPRRWRGGGPRALDPTHALGPRALDTLTAEPSVSIWADDVSPPRDVGDLAA
jgi:hypothetical protein